MKVSVIMFALVAAACAAPPGQSFDSLDVDYYRDETNLEKLVKCAGGAGPCANQLEANLKARLKTIILKDCGDCSVRELDIIVILTNFLADTNKADISHLLKLFDPSGKRSQHYLKFLNRTSEKRGLPRLPDDIINEFPPSS